VREESPRIKAGSTFAIEVMYTAGSPEIELDDDGWTISVRDGKISALFEETVAVTKKGQKVLTEYNLR
jgi:methionyl aminopeptidase